MRKILFGVVITLIVLFTFKFCDDKNDGRIILKENTVLIQQQLKNVSKLVVTEGSFSDVFNYENSKEILGDYFTAEKKALVVVNAKVSIAYNLKEIKYKLDETSKTVEILSIPEQEISINPDLEYYDVQSDFLNPFEADDYNTIKETVQASLLKKVENSNLTRNAQNRLLSELTKFYILTESLGWTLVYKEKPLTSQDDFEKLLL